MATSQASLDQYSIDELLAAIAAKGNTNVSAANEHEQQSIRGQAAREKALAEQYRRTRRAQDPVKWAEEMAQGGLPIAAAKVMAEVLSVIFERLTALESAQHNARPAHLRNVETRG
jgi:hypothetical protein